MHPCAVLVLALTASSSLAMASEAAPNQLGFGVGSVAGKGTVSGQSVTHTRFYYQRALNADWRWEVGTQRFTRQGRARVNGGMVLNGDEDWSWPTGSGRLNFESFNSLYVAAQWGYRYEGWLPYIKAGLANSQIQHGRQKKNQLHGQVAIGLGYQFTPSWSLAAEAGYVPVDSEYKLKSYGLSINYHF